MTSARAIPLSGVYGLFQFPRLKKEPDRTGATSRRPAASARGRRDATLTCPVARHVSLWIPRNIFRRYRGYLYPRIVAFLSLFFSFVLVHFSTPDGLVKRLGLNRLLLARELRDASSNIPPSHFPLLPVGETPRAIFASSSYEPSAKSAGFSRSPRNRLTGCSLLRGRKINIIANAALWSWRVHYSRLMARFTIEKSRRHRLNEPLRVALQK